MNNNRSGNICHESKVVGILSLPDEILDTLLSYTTYDEVSRLRLVCRKFNLAAQRVLNQGFYKVEKYHAQCLRKVKEQLPRRESERRKHPLSIHCDILTSIETRLSLLGMTFMKYVELKYCCFIPGKVLDEIFKVLRLVSTASVLPRAHDILLELRDISSMAMEHFDEKIAPVFRARTTSSPKLVVTPYGTFTDGVLKEDMYSSSSHRTSNISHSTSGPLSAFPSALELVKIRVALRQQNYKYLALMKESTDAKHQLKSHRTKLHEFERRLSEQNNILIQQNTRVAEQDRKKVEDERKFIEQEKKIVAQDRKIVDQEKKISELSKKVNKFCKSVPKLVNLTLESKGLSIQRTISEDCDSDATRQVGNAASNKGKRVAKSLLIKSEMLKDDVMKLTSVVTEGILTRQKRKNQANTEVQATSEESSHSMQLSKKRKTAKISRKR